MPTGYDSSSVVLTIGIRALRTVSICGITFLSDELVHSTTTSGLLALERAGASLVTRTFSFLPEADDVAEILTELRRIDIDPPAILNPLRDAIWRATAAPIGPRP